jgi:hypothetical protein
MYASSFISKIGKTATETYDILKLAFEGETMSRIQISDQFPSSKVE